MTKTRLMAWGAGLLYPVMLLLVVDVAPRASGALHAIGGLLASSLLIAVLRHRLLLALAMTLVGSVVLVPASLGQSPDRFASFLAVDLVLSLVVATRSRRVATVCVALWTTLQMLTIVGFTHGPNGLFVGLIALLVTATSCMIALLFRERREHTVALRSQQVAKAVTAERLRIARELHDMVAHSIGIIAIQAGVGSRVIETQPAEAREALRAIEATSRETLSGLRRTLVALRQAEAHTDSTQVPLAPAPGLADIEQLAVATANAGVRVDVRWAGERRRLPADIDLSAYRIVQEAVTNVVRHAGTGHCSVAIGYGAEDLSVEVLDEGRGTPGAVGSGFGITGMR